MRNLGIPVSEEPQAHGMVPQLLQSKGDLELETAGGVLRDLHGLRRIADYRLKLSPGVESRSNAMKAVLDAHRIVQMIDEFSNDAVRHEAVGTRVLDKFRLLIGKMPPDIL